MAEERLIDTDKDKKYRIRKNADGEDELYVVDGEGGEEDEDAVFFVEENTEEQVQATEYSQPSDVAEDASAKAVVAELLEKARADCAEGKYSTAVEYLERVIEVEPENGDAYVLEVVAYTKNFTDYSKISVVGEYEEEIKAYVDESAKVELLSRCECEIKSNIERLTGEIAELDKNNEEQKQKRAKKFLADRRNAFIAFVCLFAAFGASIGVSVRGFLNIYAVRGSNANLILGIVFAVLAAAFAVCTVVATRKLIVASRRVRLNKSNFATKLGRELIAKRAELDAFTAVYAALKG